MKQKMMILDATLITLLVGLFVILSPGLILTLPSLGASELIQLGVAYNSGENHACASGAVINGDPICDKATRVLVSGYTSPLATVVHTLVFAAVLYLLPNAIGLGRFSQTQILVFAGAFLALSPGLLLTLPALSLDECGSDGKNIVDTIDGNYCNAEHATGKCATCSSAWRSGETSTSAVLVHAVLFGVVCYALAYNYL